MIIHLKYALHLCKITLLSVSFACLFNLKVFGGEDYTDFAIKIGTKDPSFVISLLVEATPQEKKLLHSVLNVINKARKFIGVKKSSVATNSDDPVATNPDDSGESDISDSFDEDLSDSFDDSDQFNSSEDGETTDNQDSTDGKRAKLDAPPNERTRRTRRTIELVGGVIDSSNSNLDNPKLYLNVNTEQNNSIYEFMGVVEQFTTTHVPSNLQIPSNPKIMSKQIPMHANKRSSAYRADNQEPEHKEEEDEEPSEFELKIWDEISKRKDKEKIKKKQAAEKVAALGQAIQTITQTNKYARQYTVEPGFRQALKNKSKEQKQTKKTAGTLYSQENETSASHEPAKTPPLLAKNLDMETPEFDELIKSTHELQKTSLPSLSTQEVSGDSESSEQSLSENNSVKDENGPSAEQLPPEEVSGDSESSEQSLSENNSVKDENDPSAEQLPPEEVPSDSQSSEHSLPENNSVKDENDPSTAQLSPEEVPSDFESSEHSLFENSLGEHEGKPSAAQPPPEEVPSDSESSEHASPEDNSIEPDEIFTTPLTTPIEPPIGMGTLDNSRLYELVAGNSSEPENEASALSSQLEKPSTTPQDIPSQIQAWEQEKFDLQQLLQSIQNGNMSMPKRIGKKEITALRSIICNILEAIYKRLPDAEYVTDSVM